ncbi:MAG: heavy metal-associated domain-containing protein, partial [Firmicutes bacterium]|nr:heavy metal-associated domain-containing protein [Bacillota bacterium]
SLSSICVVTNALRLNLFDIYRQSKKHRADSGLAESVGRAIAEFKGENSLSLKKAVKIDGMMCEHCTAFIKDTLSKLDGVVSVEVSLEAGEAEVTLSKPVDESTLSAPVIEGGYTVVSITDR